MRATSTFFSPDSSVAVSAAISWRTGDQVHDGGQQHLPYPGPSGAEPRRPQGRVPFPHPTFRPVMISSLVKGSPAKTSPYSPRCLGHGLHSARRRARPGLHSCCQEWDFHPLALLVLGASVRFPVEDVDDCRWYACCRQMGRPRGPMDFDRFLRRASQSGREVGVLLVLPWET